MDFVDENGELSPIKEKLYFKALALGNGITRLAKQSSKKLFAEKRNASWREKISFIHNDLEPVLAQIGCPSEQLAHKVIQSAIDVNNAQYKRYERVFKRVGDMVRMSDLNCWFGTITLNNEILKNTSVETRRRYVARYLKEIAPFYLANIDFGDKRKNANSKEREHYHCIVCCNNKPDKVWAYGFTMFLPIPKNDIDEKRISKYITKLSLHALKQSKELKSPRLIYSRNVLPF